MHGEGDTHRVVTGDIFLTFIGGVRWILVDARCIGERVVDDRGVGRFGGSHVMSRQKSSP